VAIADLQPALEEGQPKGGDMEKAPEIRDSPAAKFRLLVAEYASESGTV